MLTARLVVQLIAIVVLCSARRCSEQANLGSVREGSHARHSSNSDSKD